ncbi:prepilin peptidase [Pelagibius sp. Alg239-R121]|uniref:A24 family peptidase n=1 Tax=Pelagibius sp. Alg239-R121 TaxID=2993448 RepID=UPI0024A63572|nr:prepilin peptidase [Pelagibius sp. Alg239-R121]
MFYDILNDTTVCIFALVVAAAAYSDVKSFTLPNVYSLSLIILYPAFVLSSGGAIDWVSATGIAAASLVVGFGLFALKICGGGDVKLFAAVSLWAGPALFLEFTLLMALSGGLIAIGLWLTHRASFLVPFLPQGLSCDSETFAKKPMPYGVAIAVGAVYVAFTLLR